MCCTCNYVPFGRDSLILTLPRAALPVYLKPALVHFAHADHMQHPLANLADFPDHAIGHEPTVHQHIACRNGPFHTLFQHLNAHGEFVFVQFAMAFPEMAFDVPLSCELPILRVFIQPVPIFLFSR